MISDAAIESREHRPIYTPVNYITKVVLSFMFTWAASECTYFPSIYYANGSQLALHNLFVSFIWHTRFSSWSSVLMIWWIRCVKGIQNVQSSGSHRTGVEHHCSRWETVHEKCSMSKFTVFIKQRSKSTWMTYYYSRDSEVCIQWSLYYPSRPLERICEWH